MRTFFEKRVVVGEVVAELFLELVAQRVHEGRCDVVDRDRGASCHDVTLRVARRRRCTRPATDKHSEPCLYRDLTTTSPSSLGSGSASRVRSLS